jgi:ribosome-associated heat shock protein Hsp15
VVSEVGTLEAPNPRLNLAFLAPAPIVETARFRHRVLSSMPELSAEVRLDKWLWAVRVFKTRTHATEACRSGKITVDGQQARPARGVRSGQIVAVNLGGWTRTLRVRNALERRVAAAAVPEHADDLTSPEERERGRERRVQNLLARPSGEGRPTKRERRAWDQAFLGPLG